MRSYQVLQSKVLLLLYRNLLHLNLGTAIHLPLCSMPSCASSYRVEFPNSDTAGGNELKRVAIETGLDCRATGLDVAENPPQALA